MRNGLCASRWLVDSLVGGQLFVLVLSDVFAWIRPRRQRRNESISRKGLALTGQARVGLLTA